MEGPIDRSLSALAAAVFAGVSRARGKRAVHTHGIGFEGVLTLRPGPGLALLPAFGEPREVPALYRLSASFDLPRPLPDLLGVAVKLPGLHGPGRDQDLLLVSCLGGRASKYVPWPTRDPGWRAFSSILPYRCARRLVLPGALGAGGAGRFELAVAPAGGPLLAFGALEAQRRLPYEATQALCFDPFTTGGGLEPAAGPLNGMRRAAYRASRRARPDAKQAPSPRIAPVDPIGDQEEIL